MIYGERCTGPSKAFFFPRQSVSGSLSERSVTPALSSVNWFHGLEFFLVSDKPLTISEFQIQCESRILYEENEKCLYTHSSIVLNILSTVCSLFVDLWLVKKKKKRYKKTNFQQGNILRKSIWSPGRTDKKVSSKLVKILSSFVKVIISKNVTKTSEYIDESSSAFRCSCWSIIICPIRQTSLFVVYFALRSFFLFFFSSTYQELEYTKRPWELSEKIHHWRKRKLLRLKSVNGMSIL